MASMPKLAEEDAKQQQQEPRPKLEIMSPLVALLGIPPLVANPLALPVLSINMEFQEELVNNALAVPPIPVLVPPMFYFAISFCKL